jgi:hypothetical protein
MNANRYSVVYRHPEHGYLESKSFEQFSQAVEFKNSIAPESDEDRIDKVHLLGYCKKHGISEYSSDYIPGCSQCVAEISPLDECFPGAEIPAGFVLPCWQDDEAQPVQRSKRSEDPTAQATVWATYLESLRKGVLHHARFWGVEAECERDPQFAKALRRLNVEDDLHARTTEAAFSAFNLGMKQVDYWVELDQ